MDTPQTGEEDKVTEVYHRLGAITRQLHDALNELGYADKLKGTAEELPDAQSRLQYIARLTGEAAEKVLNHVDEAKAEVAAYQDAHPRGKEGRVVYDLRGDFSVTPEEVRTRYTDYMNTFPVQIEVK